MLFLNPDRLYVFLRSFQIVFTNVCIDVDSLIEALFTNKQSLKRNTCRTGYMCVNVDVFPPKAPS